MSKLAILDESVERSLYDEWVAQASDTELMKAALLAVRAGIALNRAQKRALREIAYQLPGDVRQCEDFAHWFDNFRRD